MKKKTERNMKEVNSKITHSATKNTDQIKNERMEGT